MWSGHSKCVYIELARFIGGTSATDDNLVRHTRSSLRGSCGGAVVGSIPTEDEENGSFILASQNRIIARQLYLEYLRYNNAACRYSCCFRVKKGRIKSGRPDSVHNVVRSEVNRGALRGRSLGILQSRNCSSIDYRSCSRGDMGFSIVVLGKLLTLSCPLTWSTSICILMRGDEMNPWHAFNKLLLTKKIRNLIAHLYYASQGGILLVDLVLQVLQLRH